MIMSEPNQTAAEYLRACQDFNRRARELGLEEVSRYYWYHTVELPRGLITPGLYDFRATYSCFGFPEDMRGLKVMDVGSATGFFAFEFAKRGARVTSVELPSLYALDRFPGQNIQHSLDEIQRMMFPESVDETRGFLRRYTAEELYFCLLEGPFEFCRTQLGLAVERLRSSVYDLPKDRAGEFDLVFMGDILLHTIDPLTALAAAARLCRGTLVLAQVMPEDFSERPAMLYVGGNDPARDEVQWWWPNKLCLVQLLEKLGFQKITEHGRHTGVLRSSGYVFDRTILHAVR